MFHLVSKEDVASLYFPVKEEITKATRQHKFSADLDQFTLIFSNRFHSSEHVGDSTEQWQVIQGQCSCPSLPYAGSENIETSANIISLSNV